MTCNIIIHVARGDASHWSQFTRYLLYTIYYIWSPFARQIVKIYCINLKSKYSKSSCKIEMLLMFWRVDNWQQSENLCLPFDRRSRKKADEKSSELKNRYPLDKTIYFFLCLHFQDRKKLKNGGLEEQNEEKNDTPEHRTFQRSLQNPNSKQKHSFNSK